MMSAAGNKERARKSLQKLARTLLATTCLTGASSGVALGSVITEGLSPAPGDFPNTANGYALPVGTTQVNGAISLTTDPADWFEFTGLLGGSSFSLRATAPGTAYSDNLTLQSDTSVNIAGPIDFSHGNPANLGPLTVPADGNLVVGITQGEGGGNYTIILNGTLAPTGTPEPATFAGVGLALAGALAWRRKRSQ